MKQTRDDFQVSGKKGYVLKEKLKMLKSKIKVWNKEVFDGLDLDISKLASDMNDLDQIISEVGDMEDIAKLKKLTIAYWNIFRLKDSLLKQKSRANWIKEGDPNTRFFHACLRNRKISNQLVSLIKDGDPLVDVEEVKQEVKSFFEGSYGKMDLHSPILNGVEFSRKYEDQYALLISPFSEEDVKETVWDCE